MIWKSPLSKEPLPVHRSYLAAPTNRSHFNGCHQINLRSYSWKVQAMRDQVIQFHFVSTSIVQSEVQFLFEFAELYIINTIGEQPSYIRVDDTCYSPGEASVYLIHMPMWNLILTGSKNDARINILVADGSTEPPSWMQLSFVSFRCLQLPDPIALNWLFSGGRVTDQTTVGDRR